MECVYAFVCVSVFSSPGPGYTGVSCFEPLHSSAPLFSLSPSKKTETEEKRVNLDELSLMSAAIPSL